MSAHNHIQKDYHHTAWTHHASRFHPLEEVTIPLDRDLVDVVRDRLEFDTSKSRVFDNGTGHGALSSVIKAQYPHVQILATDLSPGMFSHTKTRASTEKWRQFDARLVDSRNLEGIEDNTFTHTLSSFMICMAPDPHLIMQEMYRVTAPGGLLGLATWGTPYYGYWEKPWAKACRLIDEKYQSTMLMSPEWTIAKEVAKNVEAVGFKDVKAVETERALLFTWVDDAMDYFFEGGNPGCVKMLKAWEDMGHGVEEVKDGMKKALEEEYGDGRGGLRGMHHATLVTAWK